MEIINKKIAVIIDFDNFNKEEYLKILFDELSEMGDIIYKGAFYANTSDRKVEEKGIKFGINDFIIEPAYTKGKNAVDIRIALDTMELLNKDYIDCFCLATTDSDFAPVIKRIKHRNKIVIGAGLNNANEEYKKLCHRFISVDTIYSALDHGTKKEVTKKTSVKPNAKAKVQVAQNKDNQLDLLVAEVKKIIRNNDVDSDGYVQLSIVVENLYKKFPDFNPKNYGAVSNKVGVFFKSALSNEFNTKQVDKTLYIKNKI